MTSFRSLKRFVCDWQGIALSMMWTFLLEWTVFVSRRENFTESSKRRSQAEWTYNPKLSAQLCWTLKWWRPKAQFYDPECFKNYNTLVESLKKKTILYFTLPTWNLVAIHSLTHPISRAPAPHWQLKIAAWWQSPWARASSVALLLSSAVFSTSVFPPPSLRKMTQGQQSNGDWNRATLYMNIFIVIAMCFDAT